MPLLADGPNGVAGTLCVLLSNGRVACTGGAATPPQEALHEKRLTMVTGLPPVDDVTINDIGNAACAITSAGDVWCWGDNSTGAAGTGSVSPYQQRYVRPARVSGLPATSAVAGSGDAFCALALDRSVWCWGRGGALAVPERRPVPIPRQISGLPPIVEIDAASDHACGRTADGAVWCWGTTTSVEPGLLVGSGATAFVDTEDHEVCALSAGALVCAEPELEDPR